MPTFRIIFSIAFLIVFSAQGVFAEKFVKDELLVKYKNGTASAEPFSINTLVGASVLEEFPELKWQRVKLPAHLSVEQAILRYGQFAEIEAVQPNFYYKLAVDPNDTRFSDLYGLQKISAPTAWDTATGTAETVVAVIDTGIKYTHEDLAANMWTNNGEIQENGVDDDGNGFIDDYYGYDFFFNDSDPDDEFGSGHGTHVAGTIGAVGNNAQGVVGINWNVRLMAIKIYDSTGFGTTSTMLINAYNYVRMMKGRGVNIKVTNNSYSGCDEACGFDQATKDAIEELGKAGVLQVFAAGNNGRDTDAQPAYPGSYNSPSVLTVAASTSQDNRAGFSNFGVENVDVAAPGSGILSTIRTATTYGFSSGTSMASPHGAGAAALLASHNPNLSPSSLKATLLNTVDVLPQWEGVVKTGGRINVANALQNQTVCDITLDRESQQVFPEGGSFSINVSAAQNCDYSVTKDAFFVTITSEDMGSGNSVVTFDVAQNSDLPRSGTIMIGERVFTVNQNPGKIFPHRGFLDFDGDGRTDYLAIQNVSGGMLWHYFRSTLGYSGVNFGFFDGDVPVPGLYDSDLINDVAVWRESNGVFYILRSEDNTFDSVQFGISGDNPRITQDFDGDEKADLAVTRKENGKLTWFISLGNGNIRVQQFGNDTDIPLRGDFDGDGKADLAVYRPATDSPANSFFVLKSSDGGLLAVTFGISTTDKIVPADYDGDGKTDFAVWRETTGVWHYLKSSDGSYNAFHFGASGDLPTPGDYDGDGRTDFSVWRPNQSKGEPGVFHVYSLWMGYSAFGWGNSTMKIPGNILQGQ